MADLWGREPALIVGLINAGIVLGVSFGLKLTQDQTAAILAFTSIVLAVITRSQVTPK